MRREKRPFCLKCGKECFDRRSQAERVVYAHKRRRHSKECGSVYLCEHCGKYHITHYSYAKSKDMKEQYKMKIRLNLFEV